MSRDKFLPFSLPSIGEEEIAEVVDSLRSGWVTSGPKVKRFESDFAAYVGNRHALAVNSCTAALHLALAALDIGPGDEVILPTLTFCSTANVVVHLGARPVLVDVRDDFNLDPEAVAAAVTPRTKAIVPVHYSGQPCDLAAVRTIAARHRLAVVEDAAHAVGAEYNGRKIGATPLTPNPESLIPAQITCFSFYAIKNLTTGEGGMITTDDEGLAERIRRLSLHGMSRDAWNRYASDPPPASDASSNVGRPAVTGAWHYEVLEAGYKENMTDLQASLGLHQLRKLDGFIERRAAIARRYSEAFAAMPEIETPIVHDDHKHAWHLFVIRLGLERLALDRARFIEELRARKVGTSVHFIPVHLHPFYRDQFDFRPGAFPCAERLYERIISLPLYPAMTDQDVDDVIEAVRAVAALA